jgi:UDPglucose 6-dehydrogenase
MKVSVVGTGYVGLVTGTCFAETGNEVTCIDIDDNKIKKLQSGKISIYEPDLEGLFKRNIKEGRLHFTNDLSSGVDDAQIIFLALPTPPNSDGSANLSYILDVAEKLGSILDHYTVVVNKSTVPVGSADRVRKKIAESAKVEFDVVSNPEFLREGFAVTDFMKPDRVIIGTSSQRAKNIMSKLYTPLVRQGNPIYFMDERSSEITKYAANSFLATKISFMNEMANLCELVGADVDAVRYGIGADERIGRRFLFPGIGYGGSCFPKDIMALQHTAKEHNYDLKILEAVSIVNTAQKQKIINKMNVYFDNELGGKTFVIWGLAFKPDTDDIREAPSLEIIKSLISARARLVVYDPEASGNARRFLGKLAKSITFATDAYEALNGADGLIIATEWSEFRTPDLVKIKRLLKFPVIFDGRNLYDPHVMSKAGFHYESIGRETIKI